MSQVYRKSTAYYIPTDALTVVPNQYDSARMVAISTSGTCRITLDAVNYNDIIGLNSAGNNPSWNLNGQNKVLNSDFDEKEVYIYAKCNIPANGSYDTGLIASVVLSSEDYTGKEELTDDADGKYIYVRLGSLSAPSAGKRSVSLDFGLLDTSSAMAANTRSVAASIVSSSIGNSQESQHAAEADHASEADHAASADTASEAEHATEADHAASAADLDEEKQKELDDKFLRKDQDDETDHDITVNGTLRPTADVDLSGDAFIEDEQGGRLWHVGTDGRSVKLQVDHLRVNKKMSVETLEVSHTEHIAGNLIMSGAKATLKSVESAPVTGSNGLPAYRCVFTGKDSDGNATYNTWKVGDYAYCKLFDVSNFQGKNVENHYYWRKVVGVGTYGSGDHYIDLSFGDCDSGSDIPYAGDYVVLRGSSVEGRQGTIEMNSVGEGSPSIFIYEGVGNTPYVMPTPIARMSPSEFSVIADKFFLSTTGDSKTIAEYVSDATGDSLIVIIGDDMEPSDNLSTYYEEAGVVSDEELLGAFYVSPEWRIWKLELVDGDYVWKESTDQNLNFILQEFVEQKEIINNITDDYCITPDELAELEKVEAEIDVRKSRVESVMAKYASANSIRIESEANYFFSACTQLVKRFVEIRSKVTCWFKDKEAQHEASHVLSFTRKEFNNSFAQVYLTEAQFNDAVVSLTASNIGESAAAEAKQSAIEYVEQHIGEILDASTKDMVDGWIKEYTDGTFATKVELEATNESFSQLVKWMSDDGFSVGGTGIKATLSSMFVGTSSVTFEQKEDEDGRPLWWGNEAHTSYSYKSTIYGPVMVVSNISTSGLVTDTNFAALVARVEDAEGNIEAQAEMATFCDKKYVTSTTDTSKKYYQDGNGNWYYWESNAVISADHVVIASNRKENNDGTFSYNFYLDEEGNVIMQDLWAKNITVEGVINNMINVLDKTSDKFIKNLNKEYDLDILRVGNYIKITSLPGVGINLPYWISSDNNCRTITRHGNKEHLITPDELRQLAGRRIIVETAHENGDNMAAGNQLKGLYNLEPVEQDANINIRAALNGYPLFKVPTDSVDMRLMCNSMSIIEFRAVHIKDGDTITQAFVWTRTDLDNITLGQETIDDVWLDEEE